MENKKVIPLSKLRDTNYITKELNEDDTPIYVTKNGKEDLVILKSNSLNKEQVISNNSDNHMMVKVCCATNDIEVANVSHNVESIINIINDTKEKDIDILVFPELCISGYSCGDLFFFNSLIDEVYEKIDYLLSKTRGVETLIFVGAPLVNNDKLYNCAIAIYDGNILGVVPKSNLPAYNEFYENRVFVEYSDENTTIQINDKIYPFGTKIIYVDRRFSSLKVSCELCEDLWAVNTPSTGHVLAGANIIVNLSASNELYGKDETRKMLVKSSSSRLACAYLYASAGNGESTQDVVYSGHNIIAENGIVLEESNLFDNQVIISDIDLDIINATRRKNSSFKSKHNDEYKIVYFDKDIRLKSKDRKVSSTPFIISELSTHDFTNEMIRLQIKSLEKRIKVLNKNNIIMNLDDNVESLLCLLVVHDAFINLNLDTRNIHCLVKDIDKYSNLKEKYNIDLVDNIDKNDIVKVLKYKDKKDAFIVDSCCMSTLAIKKQEPYSMISNYQINCSVPKSLATYLVNKKMNESYVCLDDDLINDFILYYHLKYRFSASKILYYATIAFKVDKGILIKIIDKYFDMFYNNQMERATLKDGPKVTDISLSPRGDLRVPSDQSFGDKIDRKGAK